MKGCKERVLFFHFCSQPVSFHYTPHFAISGTSSIASICRNSKRNCSSYLVKNTLNLDAKQQLYRFSHQQIIIRSLTFSISFLHTYLFHFTKTNKPPPFALIHFQSVCRFRFRISDVENAGSAVGAPSVS